MVLYFAYGSNMWQEQIKERCPDYLYLGKGILTGFRFIITTRGYANIIISEADKVHGLVYMLSEEDEASLDISEGVQNGSYRKETLPIEVEKATYSCLVYIDPIETEGCPKEEYINRINKGVADADLPTEYVEHYIRKFIPLQ
ncbi:MAG: gamma-glutamylcyclotransferase [Desulfuromonadales bacterium]|nr:gamma-glutamylcyclotransferase [Desulfuromonadales bacterium]